MAVLMTGIAGTQAAGPSHGDIDSTRLLQLSVEDIPRNASGAAEASAGATPVEEIAAGELHAMENIVGKGLGAVESIMGKQMDAIKEMMADELSVMTKNMADIVDMKRMELGLAKREQGTKPRDPANQSSGVGDPHVVNIARARFEIRADGVHKLVQIPRLIHANGKPSLRVDAKIQHLVSNDCSKSFVTSLSIFGVWTEDDFGLLRITQGSDMPNTTLLINTQGPEEYFRQFPHPDVEAGRAHIALKLGNVSFHVGKHFEGRYGKQQAYLNVRIAGLKKYGDVGGLLGYDDHTNAEKPTANCTAAQPAAATQSSFIGAGRSAPGTDGGSRIEAE